MSKWSTLPSMSPESHRRLWSQGPEDPTCTVGGAPTLACLAPRGALTRSRACPEWTEAQRDEDVPKATQHVSRKVHPGAQVQVSEPERPEATSAHSPAAHWWQAERQGPRVAGPNCTHLFPVVQSGTNVSAGVIRGPDQFPLKSGDHLTLRSPNHGSPLRREFSPAGGRSLPSFSPLEPLCRRPCWGPRGGVSRHLRAQNGLRPVGTPEPGLRGTGR